MTLVQVRNGPVGMAVLSSASRCSLGSVSAANLGAIAEGADFSFRRRLHQLLDRRLRGYPKIKTPGELRSECRRQQLERRHWIVTVARPRIVGLVRSQTRFKSARWATFGGLGGVLAGNVDVAYLSYTYAKIVQNKGFRVLADWRLPIVYQEPGSSRGGAHDSSSTTVENVIKGLLDALPSS